MNNLYICWRFFKGLSDEDCERISKMAEGNYEAASVKDDYTNLVRGVDRSSRDTDVYFSADDWLYEVLCPYVSVANESAGWEYDIDWYETIQIAKYSKDQHYARHRDGGSDVNSVYDEKSSNHRFLHGKVRKLSLCAILSDEYSGGNFQISVPHPKGSNIISPSMRKGSVIVFPSYYYHRVAPVTGGIRHSLSMWCLGSPFK